MIVQLSDFYDIAFKCIEECRQNQSTIFIHCFLGKSRSASIIIAYLIKYCKYTYDEAFNYLKLRRRLIQPNLCFARQLKKLTDNNI